MTKSPFVDSSFAVPVFSPRDDLIACLNKVMAFLTAVASSRFPSTNNQLKISSNPRNQATIQDGRVTMQQVQGRQGQNYSCTIYKGNATSSKGNTTSGQARVFKCYNCQDPGIPAGQAQIIIPHNAAFQTEDLDTYDSDCDDLSTAQAVRMANISNYGSDVISEVPNSETYMNDMDNQMDVPSELPKVSLVNASLKKLKFHLTQFDLVVKKRTTPNSLEEGEWGENAKEENVNHDKCDLEPINKELENSVAKLLSENECLCNEINHMKQVFKDQFDSIKQTRVRHKEQCYLQNRDAHIDYLRHTQEQANTLQEIVKQAKAKQPLDSELDFACKYATRIQELLVYVQDTCPNTITPSPKKVAITPINKVKKVRFAEPLTSSSNIKQVESSNTSDSNTPVLSSTGVECSTSNYRSKPSGNKRNNRISQTPSRNKKNKVEAQLRKLKKTNRVVKPICDVDVKYSLLNANYEILCAICNKSMFDGVHDKCLLDLVQNGNNRTKSAKKLKKQNIWKPTGHVFTKVGFKWKPTGRTFTIVSNACPLTRFTSTNIVPHKQTTSHSDEIQKPEIKVYSMKPKNVKNIDSSKIAKIVKSKNVNHSKPNQTWGSNAIDIPSSSSLVMTGCLDYTLVSRLRIFGNDQIARIMGYGDYQLGNVVISRVYYVEGLGHNLFSFGQFCDADLEVAFWKNICFIRNLEGVDLLLGSRDINLYIISLDDMLKSSPICLLSKSSKTKTWLWHR
ncbi:hypothetical protein Tco_1227887 [Tanacetum coccineum]